MVEDCAEPGRLAVAGRTAGREPRRLVIRIQRGLVVLQMAGVALRRGALIVGRVTPQTVRRPVGAEQRERRAVVVEDRAEPGRLAVAERTVAGEARILVIRIGCGKVLLEMTALALRRSVLERRRVTSLTVCRLVGAEQGKARPVVIEDRAEPGPLAVAGGAIRGEATRLVIRITGGKVVAHMARLAFRGNALERRAMTRAAGDRSVSAENGETGRAMIEVFGGPPDGGPVTPGTVGGEAAGPMAGLGGREVVVHVAGLALHRRVHELRLPLRSRGMTCLAVHGSMGADQRKARRLVSPAHPHPVDEATRRMAAGAVDSQFSLMDVEMAADAGRVDLFELEGVVAAATGDAGVRAEEREAEGDDPCCLQRIPGDPPCSLRRFCCAPRSSARDILVIMQ